MYSKDMREGLNYLRTEEGIRMIFETREEEIRRKLDEQRKRDEADKEIALKALEAEKDAEIEAALKALEAEKDAEKEDWKDAAIENLLRGKADPALIASSLNVSPERVAQIAKRIGIKA